MAPQYVVRIGNLRSCFVRGHNGRRLKHAETRTALHTTECCTFTTTVVEDIPGEMHSLLTRAAENDVITPSPPLGLEEHLGCISS